MLPYLLTTLISIHEWHVAVKEDQVVVTQFEVVQSYVRVYHLQCLLAVQGEVTEGVGVDAYFVSKDDFDSFDVEMLVVYDQDTVRVVD